MHLFILYAHVSHRATISATAASDKVKVQQATVELRISQFHAY